MTGNIKVGNAILCEFVGRGEGAKATLVNTYGGDVLVAAFPAVLGFGIYSELFLTTRPLPGTIIVTIDGVKTLEATTEFGISNGVDPAICALGYFQMFLQKGGTLEATLRIEGYRAARLIRKKVRVLESTSPTGS